VEVPDRDTERTEDTQETRFLPPEPAGPEPELGDRPQPEPSQAAQPQPAQTYGYPPGQAYAPPAAPLPGAPGQMGPPPPGGPGQQPPPGYGYPPPGQGYPPPWGYAQQAVPDNGQAVVGFVFSLVSLGLLIISAGLSSIVSLGCAVVGIVCSRNGKRKVDAGETPKHRGLAQAGFIIGWVSLVLSILATIGWILFIVLAAAYEDFDQDDSDSITAAASAVRAGARLLGA
jgi:hypothetical protein